MLSAVIAAGGGLGLVLAGPIAETLGRRWLFWVPAIVVTVTALMTRGYAPEPPVRCCSPRGCGSSCARVSGLGLAYGSMTGLVVRSVPAAQTGVASGLNAGIRTIGGSIGTAVVSSVITGRLRPDESGFTHGFALPALASAAAVGLTLLVPSVRRSAAAEALRRVPARSRSEGTPSWTYGRTAGGHWSPGPPPATAGPPPRCSPAKA